MQVSAAIDEPKAKAQSWSIRRQMLALVAAIGVPLIGLTAFGIYADFRHDGVQAGNLAQLLARTTAGYLGEQLASNRAVLERFAKEPRVRALDPSRCSPLMRDYLAFHPDVADIATLDTQGRVVCSGAQAASGRSIHRLGKERLAQVFAIGAPLAPRVLAPAGATQLSMQIHSLSDGQGRRTGFLALLMDVGDYLPEREFTAEEPGLTYDVMDGEGLVVSHLPDTDRWSRAGLRGSELAQSVLGRQDGPLRTRGVDGVERVYGFTAIAGSNWHTIVGLPAHEVDAPATEIARRHAAIAFAIVLAVAFITVALGRKITQPIARIAEAAKAASEGRPTRAPVQGAAEIVEVARQFNHMLAMREQTDAVLRGATERLQVLSRRLLDIQESERRQVARELHDEIGQALTAVKIHLQAMQRAKGTGAPHLDECIAIVGQALEQVRSLCLDLRPPLLDDLGLAPALRWLLDRQADPAGLNACFMTNLDPTTRLHPDLEIVCFRVAQEALTNVVRHARAREVRVRLEVERGRLLLSVRDDGCGFDLHDSRRRGLAGECMGLLSIGERVSLLGGHLDLESAPGGGTEVRVQFALSLAPAALPANDVDFPPQPEARHVPDPCPAGR